MSITGESFDYGPFAFIPTYDLRFTAAYFDDLGFIILNFWKGRGTLGEN